MIYLIADLSSLKQIESAVEKLVPGSNQSSPSDLPWLNATLQLKSITSFEDEVKRQGRKKITFEQLYPFIDDTEGSEDELEDLLAALN